MKKLLIVLFVGFLLFDILLAIKIFYPQLTLKQGIRSVSVRSEISSQRAHLTNEDALRKKLDDLDFWSKQRVNRYKLVIDKVTVEHLIFVITDKPQYLGQRVDNKVYQYSFGQTYDSDSRTLAIYLQLNPEYQKETPLEKRLSNLAMYALFDHVYSYPKKDERAYNLSLTEFIKNAPVILRFGLI